MSFPSLQCLLVHLGPGLVADPVLIVALTGNTRLIREAKSTGVECEAQPSVVRFLSAGSTRSHMSDPRLWEEKSMAAPGVQHKCGQSWASFSSLCTTALAEWWQVVASGGERWQVMASDGERGQGWPLSSHCRRLITLQPRRESMLP
ncbi:hypothetical protein V8C34DRAFT_285155 [Trichoderma compactum]